MSVIKKESLDSTILPIIQLQPVNKDPSERVIHLDTREGCQLERFAESLKFKHVQPILISKAPRYLMLVYPTDDLDCEEDSTGDDCLSDASFVTAYEELDITTDRSKTTSKVEVNFDVASAADGLINADQIVTSPLTSTDQSQDLNSKRTKSQSASKENNKSDLNVTSHSTTVETQEGISIINFKRQPSRASMKSNWSILEPEAYKNPADVTKDSSKSFDEEENSLNNKSNPDVSANADDGQLNKADLNSTSLSTISSAQDFSGGISILNFKRQPTRASSKSNQSFHESNEVASGSDQLNKRDLNGTSSSMLSSTRDFSVSISMLNMKKQLNRASRQGHHSKANANERCSADAQGSAVKNSNKSLDDTEEQCKTPVKIQQFGDGKGLSYANVRMSTPKISSGLLRTESSHFKLPNSPILRHATESLANVQGQLLQEERSILGSNRFSKVKSTPRIRHGLALRKNPSSPSSNAATPKANSSITSSGAGFRVSLPVSRSRRLRTLSSSSSNGSTFDDSSSFQGKRRKKHRSPRVEYSLQEVQTIIKGVKKYGLDFKAILFGYRQFFDPKRTPVSLYDKWRHSIKPQLDAIQQKKKLNHS